MFLPLQIDELVERALRPAGDQWVERFHACLSNPRVRKEFTGDDLDPRDPSLFEYAVRISTGSAILHARYLEGQCVRLTLRDGQSVMHGQESGTKESDSSSDRLVICADGMLESNSVDPVSVVAPRPFCAVIFADFPGFSRIDDENLPGFWESVMSVIGEELRDRGAAVGLKATWGDAVHLVVTDIHAAADISLALGERVSSVDARQFGTEGMASMRIGAHYGPVFRGWDPVLRQQTYYGRVLSRAARIEPITPPGRVYVSESFASILAAEAAEKYDCTYVGKVPLAKGYGEFRMYDLSHGLLLGK